MGIISITSCFGSNNPELGVIKGIILNICPGIKFADLSHEIIPNDITGAALILERAVSFFPPNTVHIAIVDPSFCKAHRCIAASNGIQYFVGLDNGIFSLVFQAEELTSQIVELNQPNRISFRQQPLEIVKLARNVIAPAAAYLASGIEMKNLGHLIDDPVSLKIKEPEYSKNGWKTQISAVDRFGNLSTRLHRSMLGRTRIISIRLGESIIDRIVKTYGNEAPGSLVALFNSDDFLEISMVNGSAAAEINAHVGSPVDVICETEN